MATESDPFPLQQWVATLPASSMVYPDSFLDRVKYIFWRIYTPFHPIVRDTVVFFFGSQSDQYPEGRQPFVLGTIAPGTSVKDFVEHLLKKGFGNHFTAWKDRGEIVSLRHVDDFKYQYHVRVFKDGEVRAHYEYTPECHPMLHLKMDGVPFEARREQFLAFMGDTIVPSVTESYATSESGQLVGA